MDRARIERLEALLAKIAKLKRMARELDVYQWCMASGSLERMCYDFIAENGDAILRQYKESAPPVAPSLHTPPDGG